MDTQALVQALSNTLNPALREQAEALLESVKQAPEFTTSLLQIVMNDAVPLPERQAGAVYLKNSIHKSWKEREEGEEEEVPYSIPESAKTLIREHIINAIIQCPVLISRQMCVCLTHILKHDFPKKWPAVVGQIHTYLSSNNQSVWLGSLLALYQLSRKYEYKKLEDKREYLHALKSLLPLLYQRMVEVLANQSLPFVTLQHNTLKIFFSIIQFSLPLDVVNDTTLPGWIIVLQTIIQRPVPPEAGDVDEEDRPQLEWWKCKKWAAKIVHKLFERYGNPSNVDKDYAVFSNYYIKTFNVGVINALLRQLEVKRQNQYVSPPVVQYIFSYFTEGVDHAVSWKIIKPHFDVIFREIIFPVMCYSQEDDELWHSDPYEFIRMKFDLFETVDTPLTAIQQFIVRACAKRKDILTPMMAFCVQILSLPPQQGKPKQKDGALHVIGSLGNLLMKKKQYKDQVIPMLVTHVFPEFQSPLGYMRARACWMMHNFSDLKLSSQENHLQCALQMLVKCLTEDKEMPVKVEAALGLQYFITEQTEAEALVQPYAKPIMQELLLMIKETDNDEMTGVLSQFIETYSDQLGPFAVDLCSNLVVSFNSLMDAEDDSYKSLTAMGLSSTLEALVKATFSQPEVLSQLETLLLSTIAKTFQNGAIDFYNEMLSLMDLFTVSSVSPQMWQLFAILYDTFTRDGFDHFNEIMSVMYNFVKVDTETFLSNVKHTEVIITMAKKVLSDDSQCLAEDSEIHACKLLEVLVLQCQGRIDVYIPNIVEVVLERLTRQCKTPELRIKCMQVVIAVLYYNASVLLSLLEKTHFPDSTESITDQFFSQWIKDAAHFLGIHDRKISVLGFCSLLQCPVRPAPVLKMASQIVPAIITQLEGLVDAYRVVAAEDNEDEDDDDESEDEMDEETKELDSEEDADNEEDRDYLRALAKKASAALGESIADNSDDEEDDDDSEDGMTILEVDFETMLDDDDIIDPFTTFKNTLDVLAERDKDWYTLLTTELTSEHRERIQKLFVTAEQRKAAKESRKIEELGGYQFTVTAVPNNFKFST